MVMNLLQYYGKLVKKRPILTQIIMAGTITTTGDIIVQSIEKSRTGQAYNPRRTMVMSFCGFCYFGPVVSTWLGFLKSLNITPLKMVIMDQTIAAPIVNAGFVFMHPILSGKSVEESVSIFKKSYPQIIRTAWCVWLPTQSINFTLIPPEFRMLFMQTVALFWNMFLSFRTNASIKPPTD